MLLGIILVLIAGKFLRDSAHNLVIELNMPTWIIGWILGFVTSTPEMASFFEVFRLKKKQGSIKLPDDTQQALDALVASNMSNLGIILPLGMLVYLFFS
ncbi:MAG: hypothetical protein ACLFQK_03150 [Fibrobacterota bacterium]